MFGYVILSPWLVPNYALEARRPPDAALRVRFADYPYANGAPGFLFDPPAAPFLDYSMAEGGPAAEESIPSSTQPVAAQLGTEAGFDSGMIRTGFRARLQMPLRLEIDAEGSLYREIERRNVDSAWLSREHLSVRFAESRAVQFRSGIGPQHLFDSSGWVHGVDMTWGFDAFPARPVTLGFEASAGILGKALTGGVHAYIGILQGPVEVSAGWHHRWIGNVDLGGPFASIRIWL